MSIDLNPKDPSPYRRRALRAASAGGLALTLAACGNQVANTSSPEQPPSPSPEPSATAPVTPGTENQVPAGDVAAAEKVSSGEADLFSGSITTYEELMQAPLIFDGKIYETREAMLEACRIPGSATPEEAIAKLKSNLQAFAHVGQTPEEAALYNGYYDESGPTVPSINGLEGYPMNSSAVMFYQYIPTAEQCFGPQSLSPFLANMVVQGSLADISSLGNRYGARVKTDPATPTSSLEFTDEKVLSPDELTAIHISEMRFTNGDGSINDEFPKAFSIRLERSALDAEYWEITEVVNGNSIEDVVTDTSR